MKNSSLWEGLTLERLMENHFPWKGPLAGARKECEEEVTEKTCHELRVIPISYPPVQLGGGGKKHQEWSFAWDEGRAEGRVVLRISF